MQRLAQRTVSEVPYALDHICDCALQRCGKETHAVTLPRPKLCPYLIRLKSKL